MERKSTPTLLNVGTASLMVVFLVLCMVIFATLSLSGANSDLSFARRQAEGQSRYYEACNEAEELLDEIDRRVRQGEPLTDLPVEQEGDTLSWETPVDERRALSVAIELTEGESGTYRIARWQIISTEAWVADDTIPLLPLGGNAP